MSETAVTDAPAPGASIQDLYLWATWVHVGPGAEGCEDVHEDTGVVDCANPLHFHAWCRLPNQYQHRDIREAAMAAKARKIRQLRDPDSDASTVLDMEIEELASRGDAAKEELVNEVAGRDWWRDYLEAQAIVMDLEDEDGTKTFEHIQRDITRMGQLMEMTGEDRPADEEKELDGHIAAYNEAMSREQQTLIEPRTAALQARDINWLLDEVRKLRADVASNEEYTHEYATLQWVSCTLRHPDGPPTFASREQLVRSDQSVISAIQTTYLDLARTQREGGGLGNS